ncbi:alanyl (membrane) aminopeptidase-like b [Engraulis encrasicolus]|uniref:alanyl (membrane) aminopeptidase-like b n=1 Tax=Engraulis encrasicolus TaxID=184585 RepID=UPI002FCEFCA8
MVVEVLVSKTLAIVAVVMTASAIGGIVTMSVMFHLKVKADPPTTPAPTTTAQPIPTGAPIDMRLPRTVLPQSYEVLLMPLIYSTVPKPEVNQTAVNQTFSFIGNSTVTFLCVNKTKSIFMHRKSELMVSKPVLVDLATEEEIKVVLRVNESTVSETDFLEVLVTDDVVLQPDARYNLTMQFSGELLNDLAGFYSSSYEVKNEDDESEMRYLAASQMQATDARKVFPCFDEPDMKAEFNIIILHRDGTTALTNWPRKDSTGFAYEFANETWRCTEFKTTEPMSTYLVAFVVAEFAESRSTVTPKGKLIRVYARPESIMAGHADYALDVTPGILHFYEEEFAIDYPVRKLDQVALPDLGPTAMENWGLITYTESSLLYVEGVSSTFDMYHTNLVIAHELAHQWFGNLVTMRWWNEAWLNEGFATYMSYKAIEGTKRTWKADDLFVIDELQQVLTVDALASSRPLSSPEDQVSTIDQINEQFDAITYSKGAAVLRMLEHRVGTALFKVGIQGYLKALQYDNADQADLWRHIQQAYNVDGDEVETFMDGWVNQAGFPVVTVDTSTGEIRQERFLLNGNYSHNVWHVPINAMFDDGNVYTGIIFNKKGPVTLTELISEKWVLVNPNCVGYYRVNYNLENWQRLTAQLMTKRQAIPAINRGQIIDDAFNLARADYLDVAVALNTTRYLHKETEYIPWQSALNNLNFFMLMFDRSEVYGPMQAYLLQQIIPLYEHFANFTNNNTVPGTPGEQNAQLKAISMACQLGYDKCIDMAQKEFAAWQFGTGDGDGDGDGDGGGNGTRTTHTYKIHPNLQSVIYCHAIAAGGKEEWEFAWEKYLNSTLATEKDKLRYGLSCTKHIWLLNRYLLYTQDPSMIRKMDVVSTIIHVSENVAGQALAWDFVRGYWKELIEEFGEEIGYLGNLVYWVTERFSTAYELQQLMQFQSDHSDSLGSASLSLEQAIERTQANMHWVEQNKDTVLKWFEEAQ